MIDYINDPIIKVLVESLEWILNVGTMQPNENCEEIHYNIQAGHAMEALEKYHEACAKLKASKEVSHFDCADVSYE